MTRIELASSPVDSGVTSQTLTCTNFGAKGRIRTIHTTPQKTHDSHGLSGARFTWLSVPSHIKLVDHPGIEPGDKNLARILRNPITQPKLGAPGRTRTYSLAVMSGLL